MEKNFKINNHNFSISLESELIIIRALDKLGSKYESISDQKILAQSKYIKSLNILFEILIGAFSSPENKLANIFIKFEDQIIITLKIEFFSESLKFILTNIFELKNLDFNKKLLDFNKKLVQLESEKINKLENNLKLFSEYESEKINKLSKKIDFLESLISKNIIQSAFQDKIILLENYLETISKKLEILESETSIYQHIIPVNLSQNGNLLLKYLVTMVTLFTDSIELYSDNQNLTNIKLINQADFDKILEINYLSNFNNIRIIMVSHNKFIKNLKPIKNLKSAICLELYSNPNLSDISDIINLENLRNLAIKNCPQILNYNILEKLPNLELLQIPVGIGYFPKNIKFKIKTI